jgi:tetratricopeptide (TPR) repeat protein
MFPDKVLAIDYSLPSGLYCEIREKSLLDDGRPHVYFITDEELEAIEARMRQIVEADLPFTKKMVACDEAVAMFDEAIALEPNNVNLYLNKAYTYTRKGDALGKEANDMSWNDENRVGVLAAAMEAYAASIEPFEKAHELNPEDVNTVEFLKSICFQVRNEKPEYMEKYEKYNALFKQMRGM